MLLGIASPRPSKGRTRKYTCTYTYVCKQSLPSLLLSTFLPLSLGLQNGQDLGKSLDKTKIGYLVKVTQLFKKQLRFLC